MNAAKRYKDIDLPFTCPISGREFNSTKGLSIYINKTLKINHKDYYDKHIDHRDKSCFFCGGEGKFISVGKGYRNLCENPLCVKKSFNSHSVEGIMYREMCTREESILKFDIENDRQLKERMKTFSELREMNPNFDKERNQLCGEYWIKRGFNEEESVQKRSEIRKSIVIKSSETIRSNPEKYASKFPTKIEYYLSRGYSEEEGKKIISTIQNRFSLDGCKEKYGDIDGQRVWKERQEKWQESLSKNGNIKGGYSKISQDLFKDILYQYPINEIDNIYFWTKNKEYLIDDGKSIFLYDFTDIKRMKIIEYNGDQYHANPLVYSESEFPHPYNKKNGFSSKDIWEKDLRKAKLAESKGFQVLTIWDSEYRKDPVKTLEKCIDFLQLSII